MKTQLEPIKHYRLAVTGAALLFSLALGEGLLRLLFPLPPENSVVRMEALDIRGLKSRITYAVNPWGLRSLSMYSHKKPDRTIRVLCFGASTTQQYTHDTEDMWCSLLGKFLDRSFKNAGFRVETVAFGVGGMRARDNLLWLVKQQDTFEVDIIVTLLGINDLSWNGGPEYTYTGLDSLISTTQIEATGGAESELADSASFFGELKRVCVRYSAICARLKRAKNRIEYMAETKRKIETGESIEWHSKNLPRLRARRQSLPYVEDLSRDPDPIVEFKDALTVIHKVAKGYGSNIIALGQPVLWHEGMDNNKESVLWFYVNTREGPLRPSGRWLEKEMARYNDVQQDLATQNGFQYIDLNKELPKTLEVFIDDCHLTLHGSELVAKAILPALKELVAARIEETLRSQDR